MSLKISHRGNSKGFKLLTCEFKLETRECELVTGKFELVAHELWLLI